MKKKVKKYPLYAVYGSLKQGYGNNRVMGNSKLLGTTKTEPKFEMYSLGGFPGIKPGETPIEIEVFEVSEPETEMAIDRLEGYTEGNEEHNFYNKEVIKTKFGEAFIYTYNYNINEDNKIESGKW